MISSSITVNFNLTDKREVSADRFETFFSIQVRDGLNHVCFFLKDVTDAEELVGQIREAVANHGVIAKLPGF